MLELSIPQIREESKNVKDLVFTILTSEQPLSIIELTNRIKKQYILRVTYQAVRKAVNTLHEQNVLGKKGKKYSINKEWVMKLKSFFDKLLTSYEVKQEVKLFNAELAKEDYAIYTFNNLLDLDNFWGDMHKYWIDHIKPEEGKIWISYCHYSFWFLINLGQETRIIEYMKKKGAKLYQLFFLDVHLNMWGAKLYNDIGVKTKVLNNNIDDSIGLNLYGDTIVQVKYPIIILKKLRTIYKKYKSTQELTLKEITNLAHKPCEIKFIMFKNPAIAKDLRERYLKFFKY